MAGLFGIQQGDAMAKLPDAPAPQARRPDLTRWDASVLAKFGQGLADFFTAHMALWKKEINTRNQELGSAIASIKKLAGTAFNIEDLAVCGHPGCGKVAFVTDMILHLSVHPVPDDRRAHSTTGRALAGANPGTRS
jgi:hypothetical protein